MFLPQMLCEKVLKNNLDKWLLSLFFTYPSSILICWQFPVVQWGDKEILVEIKLASLFTHGRQPIVWFAKKNKWNSLFQMVIRDKLGKGWEPIFTTLFLYGTLTFSHSGPSSFSWPKMFLQKMACTLWASLSCCLLMHLISYMYADSSTMFLRHQVPRGQTFYLCHFLV